MKVVKIIQGVVTKPEIKPEMEINKVHQEVKLIEVKFGQVRLLMNLNHPHQFEIIKINQL